MKRTLVLLFALMVSAAVPAHAVETEYECTYLGFVQSVEPLKVRVRYSQSRGAVTCAAKGQLVSAAQPKGSVYDWSKPTTELGFAPHVGDFVSIRWHLRDSSWVEGFNIWRVRLLFPSLGRPLVQSGAMGAFAIGLLVVLWWRVRRSRQSGAER